MINAILIILMIRSKKVAPQRDLSLSICLCVAALITVFYVHHIMTDPYSPVEYTFLDELRCMVLDSPE